MPDIAPEYYYSRISYAGSFQRIMRSSDILGTVLVSMAIGYKNFHTRGSVK